MEIKKFEEFDLDAKLLRAITEMGFEQPSPIQAKAIPVILEGKDIVGQAQTGTGKTAAFGIPLLQMIDTKEKSLQAIVLSPTRELAIQIAEEFRKLSKFSHGIKILPIYGGQDITKQIRSLKGGIQVVIGTPGRVMDHMRRHTLKMEHVKMVVLDEADEMLNMGFIDQVEKIIKSISTDRVTMLFSATIPEEIEALINRYMKSPEKIEIESQNLISDRIAHRYFEVVENEKLDLLRRVLITHNPETCIMFCRTKDNVDKVYTYLKNNKYPCGKIHGGMMQNERLEVMNNFKKGRFPFLVATDVAARGIDVEDITEVINFDVPLEKESYVHRIGRTGRAGKNGIAITFVTPFEDRFFNEIQEYIKINIEKSEMIDEDMIKDSIDAFNKRLSTRPKEKSIKQDAVNKDITKIYLNGGKKKKVRAGDIVGAICSINGLCGDDIGIIDIQDNVSYVEIMNGKGKKALDGLRRSTIKGKKLKVEIAK